jgi:hypothetical protein
MYFSLEDVPIVNCLAANQAQDKLDCDEVIFIWKRLDIALSHGFLYKGVMIEVRGCEDDAPEYVR